MIKVTTWPPIKDIMKRLGGSKLVDIWHNEESPGEQSESVVLMFEDCYELEIYMVNGEIVVEMD